MNQLKTRANLEFYHLRSFVAVAECGNLTQAAKRLYTTPPAISGHIKALEEETESQLFTRSHRGMQLTQPGEALLSQAKHILDSANHMLSQAKQARTLEGELRLGLNQAASCLRVPQLLALLSEHAPTLSFSLSNSDSGHICHQLSQGDLEGGFIYGEHPDGTYACTIKTQALSVIAPIDMAISSEQNLATLPWITMGTQCPFDEVIARWFRQQAYSKIRSTDDRSRIELVKSGLGVSLCESELAEQLADNNEQKAEIKVLTEAPFQLPLKFVYQQKMAGTLILETLMTGLKKVWQLN